MAFLKPACLHTQKKTVQNPQTSKIQTSQTHSWPLDTHNTKNLACLLVVDDFGVKYTRQQDVDFLCSTPTDAGYKSTTNLTGTLFCKITLWWDYPNPKFHFLMPGYMEAVLCRFHHDALL